MLHIAEGRKCDTLELFQPFWRSVAVMAVKDFHKRPQTVQYLADILRMSVNQFLMFTQTETIPHLVLVSNKLVLQRIASTRNLRVLDLCMQPRRNLAAIMATLLLQQYSDYEKSIMNLLCAIAPEFAEHDLTSLVRLEPVLIVCELLKATGDTDEERKQKVRVKKHKKEHS